MGPRVFPLGRAWPGCKKIVKKAPPFDGACFQSANRHLRSNCSSSALATEDNAFRAECQRGSSIPRPSFLLSK